MPGRRNKRDQEKEIFLQQNPDLITYTTRIEVDGPDHGEDDIDVVASVNGGPFNEVFVDDDLETPNFILADSITGPGFFISSSETTDVQPGPGGLLFEGRSFAQTSVSENGFGVFGENEELNGEDVDLVCDDDGEDIPEFQEGADTIDEGEIFRVEVRPSLMQIGFNGEDYGEDEEGGVSFGIDFTASGRGSVEITLFEQGRGKELFPTPHTETFDIPFGTQPGDVLNFELDLPDDGLFRTAEVTTTGGASISVVGIDLETNFEDNGFNTI